MCARIKPVSGSSQPNSMSFLAGRSAGSPLADSSCWANVGRLRSKVTTIWAAIVWARVGMPFLSHGGLESCPGLARPSNAREGRDGRFVRARRGSLQRDVLERERRRQRLEFLGHFPHQLYRLAGGFALLGAKAAAEAGLAGPLVRAVAAAAAHRAQGFARRVEHLHAVSVHECAQG